MNNILGNKGIFVPVAAIISAALFVLNFIITHEKEKSKKELLNDTQLNALSQQVELLKGELKYLRDKVEENQKTVNEQFQEYKVRNNTKTDLLSEKIYELNARADTSEKLGKKNSTWIDNYTKEMMKREKR